MKNKYQWMKNIIMALFITISTFFIANAQQKLPNIHSVWTYGQFDCNSNSNSISTYSVTGIVTKNDTFNYTTSAYNPARKYEFVSLNNKWAIKTDTGIFTLFDYNANVGDTLFLYRTDMTNLYQIRYKVTKLDTISDTSNLVKTTLKILGTITGFPEVSESTLNGIEETYISKIGSTKSLIPILPFLAFTCSEPFLCNYKDDNLKYELTNCSPSTGTIDDIKKDYQNLLTEKNSDITEYSIYNTMGSLLYRTGEFEQFKRKLDVIYSGIYLIHFSNEKNYSKTLKIFK